MAIDLLEPLWLASPSHDSPWRPFRQSWRDASEAAFRDARARIRWQPERVVVDVVLDETHASNSATRLNEPTWRLGSVCEIFIQAHGAHYYELHITPENQRLQLRFGPGDLARVRQGSAELSDFFLNDPDWVCTSVVRNDADWSVNAVFTPESVGLPQGFRWRTGCELSVAICRYDAGGRSQPILSSTAGFTEINFHRSNEWDRLRLVGESAAQEPRRTN